MRKGIIILSVLAMASCSGLGDHQQEKGIIRVAFADEAGACSKALPDMPDTSDFILKIQDSKGKVIYDGVYSACPEALEVAAGSYTVSVLSHVFDEPAFASPQYGDEQCVIVPSSGVVNVRLSCTQLNAGVKLSVSKDFLTACPDGVLFLKSAGGKLMYGYSEKRAAYFSPGTVSLMLSRGDSDQILMSRALEAQDMLTIKVTVASSSADPEPAKGSVSVSVDTSRNWINDSCVIGDGNDKGTAPSDALTVSQALASAGCTDVWVCGYIVGGDLTSSKASFSAPFSSRTNLVLGPRSSTVDRTACLSVQLPAGELRDALNLVDRPDLLGTKVYLRGDIVDSYYGMTGVKNISEYDFR